MHLLKWQYQSDVKSSSWLGTIKEARKQIAQLVRKHPVLALHAQKVWLECYLDAREDAADETGLPLDTFPQESPYTLEQVLEGSNAILWGNNELTLNKREFVVWTLVVATRKQKQQPECQSNLGRMRIGSAWVGSILVFIRRNSAHSTKDGCEMRLAWKAKFVCNIKEWFSATFQHNLSSLNPAMNDELMHGHTYSVFKDSTEMAHAQVAGWGN